MIKKVFYRNTSFIMVFLLGILNITFASCSGESNEEGSKSSETISTLRANKWISRDVSTGEGDDDHIWVDVESTTLYFTSDDAGVVYWIQKDYDSDLGNNRTYDYEPFTYTVDGNKVIVKTETDTNTLTLLGNYLSDDDYIYEATPISSGDYELLNKISPKTGKCGNSLSYIYYPKTHALSIYGTGKMNDYSTTNQPWHNFYIENVEIQDGCTSIGANAFTNIQHVTSVELPRTLTEIGANSFAGTLITKLTIYDNVIKIGEGAFFGCNYLKTVYLSDNIEEIGADAFHACPVSETAFSLPKTLKHIGDRAFMGWKIGTLTLNNDLETIGNACFTGVKGTINIPNSVKSVGGLAFEGSFNKVVIGTGLTDLAKSAFASTASSGQFYVNLGVPLTMDGCIFNGNVSDDDIQKKWTLYVPKGSKTAYQANQYWRGFKSIIEDASLVSGNGTPEENGSEETDEEEKPNQNDITRTYVNGYSFIDLGLPSGLLWAEHNIGAKSCKDYGNYYAFGEVNTKDVYIGNNSKWYKKEYPAEKLKPEDDVATVKLGENIHTPAVSDFKELFDNCNWEVVNEQGYQGELIKYIKVKSKKNTNYIIFPLAGYYTDKLCGTNEMGNYWSSEPYYYNGNSAYCLYIHHGNNYINVYVDYDDRKIRAYGFTVRPVVKK